MSVSVPLLVHCYTVLITLRPPADRCIQNIYRTMRQDTNTHGKYPGVLASLLMLDKLSIEDIKASVTELMAEGVDTVKNLIMTSNSNHLILLFRPGSVRLYERYPSQLIS